MSAPDHAHPIAPKGNDANGKDLTYIRCVCECGWKGHVGQLLGVDDEDIDTMWCPRCGMIGWEYA